MGDIEGLVRPYLGGSVTPPQRVSAPAAGPPANVVLVIGKGGGIKSLGASFSSQLNTYMDKKEKDANVNAIEPPPAPPLEGQPEERKAHVKRVKGKTRDGDAPDSWIDLQRINRYVTKEGSGKDYQKTTLQLKWYEDAEGEIINGQWQTTKVKIIPPGEDKDDPALWFEVDVVDEFTITDADQKIIRKFKNDDSNARRKSKVRRVTHFDTFADDDPALANGGLIPTYKKTPDTEDQSQFIDYEIVGQFTRIDDDQRTIVTLGNDYLLKLTRAPDDTTTNPPRLDPLTNIINVQLDKFYPKYAAAFGGLGAQGELLFFDVGDDGNLKIRYRFNNVTGISGWYTTHGGPTDENLDSIESPLDVIATWVDWEGNLQLAGVGPSMFDAPHNGTLIPSPGFFQLDKDGSFLAELPAPPAKGVQKGGFWVKDFAISSYTGDTLNWTNDIGVFEILPGRKVLGQPGLIINDYGVYTIAQDGSITDFLRIGNGGLSFDDTFLYNYDTSSNGDTYLLSEQRFGVDRICTLQRIDQNNKVIWKINIAVVGDNTNLFKVQMVVVENKKGTFVLTTEMDAEYGDQFQFRDFYYNVFSVGGVLVSRTKWSTFIQTYRVGDGVFGPINQMGTFRSLNGVRSSTRYPVSPPPI